MGVFNYKNGSITLENAIDKHPGETANNTQIATTKWVKDRIAEHNPTGNCATGQTGSAASTSSTSSTSNTSSTSSTGSTSGTSTNTGTSTVRCDTGSGS
jgi:hypothetical protein